MIIPVDVAVGAGELVGNSSTSHCVAALFSTQPIVAEPKTKFETKMLVGLKQPVTVPQTTLAVHPGLLIDGSLLKRKVKHPSGLEDVIISGILVPQKAPANPPGTLAAGFPLEI